MPRKGGIRPEQAELARQAEIGQREVDDLLRALAAEVREIVGSVEGVMTPEARVEIMPKIDAALDRVYGSRKGAGSVMERKIVRRSQKAAAVALRRSSRTIWEEMEKREPLLMAVARSVEE